MCACMYIPYMLCICMCICSVLCMFLVSMLLVFSRPGANKCVLLYRRPYIDGFALVQATLVSARGRHDPPVIKLT